MKRKMLFLLLLIFPFNYLLSQILDPKYFQIGSPVTKDIWVDPVNGNDNNTGSSRSAALKTIRAAWDNLPSKVNDTGYRIKLVQGTYTYRDSETNAIVGLYLDDKEGTYSYPIIMESTDGPLTAQIYSSLDFQNVKYFYMNGLDIKTDTTASGGGNTVHFASADHILLKGCRLNGFDGNVNQPQETFKVNQTSNIFVEDSEISGAFWFALDYVAVQYGHIVNCRIHDANVDALLLKGGSTQILVESNYIYNADRFGFSAGQGAGFDFLVFPWLHYEAYDLKFVNNVIYSTGYSGLAILGSYNLLCAYNTFYRTGIDKNGDRNLITVGLGERGCDGVDPDTCNVHHEKGGWSPGIWSTPSIQNGTEVECIPNRNVYIFNNIFYNPIADSTVGPQLKVRGAYDGSDYSTNFLSSSNISNPSLSDENLRISGNIIWNGSKLKDIGIDENSGCQDSNPNCNKTKLLNENSINSTEPQFIDPSNLNFHPKQNGNIFKFAALSIPDFISNDRPTRPLPPIGNTSNLIGRDFDNNNRGTINLPGAFIYSTSTGIAQDANPQYSFELFQNYPNPFNPLTTINYSISKSGIVIIKVYDLLGHVVKTLINENKPAGNYKVELNAGKLTSGIYFYRIETGSYTETKKLILLK